MDDKYYQTVEKQVDHEFQEYKHIAVNKDIDETKYRISRMGEFGTLLVKDVYGNMNFQKDKAIEIPKVGTLEEYEEELKKQKLDKKMRQTQAYKDLGAAGVANANKEFSTSQSAADNMRLSKFALNKTYSIMRRHFYD